MIYKAFLYIAVSITILSCGSYVYVNAAPSDLMLAGLIEQIKPKSQQLADGIEAVVKFRERCFIPNADISSEEFHCLVEKIEKSKTETELKKLKSNEAGEMVENGLAVLLRQEDFLDFLLSEIEKIHIMQEIMNAAEISESLIQRLKAVWQKAEPGYRGWIFDYIIDKSIYKEADWRSFIEDELEKLRIDASVFNTASWKFSCEDEFLKNACIGTAKRCVDRMASRGTAILKIAVGKSELVELKKALLTMLCSQSLPDGVVEAVPKQKIEAALLKAYDIGTTDKALKKLSEEFIIDAGY